MRLFVALELPAPVVPVVVAWRDGVVGTKEGLRAVPDESLHVTLAFLGEIDPDAPALLVQMTPGRHPTSSGPRHPTSPAPHPPTSPAPHPPTTLTALCEALDQLTGAGPAPLALGSPWWLPRRRPSVLCVAVEDDDGRLRETQSLLLSALRRATGFEPERRIFFPHITVARVRRGFKVRPSPLDGPPGVEFSGARVTLFESAAGAYRPLHSVSL